MAEEFPSIAKCTVNDCEFWGEGNACHATSIWVGGNHPTCDTYERAEHHEYQRTAASSASVTSSTAAYNSLNTCHGRRSTYRGTRVTRIALRILLNNRSQAFSEPNDGRRASAAFFFFLYISFAIFESTNSCLQKHERENDFFPLLMAPDAMVMVLFTKIMLPSRISQGYNQYQ